MDLKPRPIGGTHVLSRYVIDVRCVNDVPYRLIVFIESPVFTRQVNELLTDEAYGQLQQCLAAHPKMGDVIRDSGGLRKMRWKTGGGGRRGGVRVIYYHLDARAQCRMPLIYPKGKKDDLTAAEKKTSASATQNGERWLREQEAVCRACREHDADE